MILSAVSTVFDVLQQASDTENEPYNNKMCSANKDIPVQYLHVYIVLVYRERISFK
jgi:hypothetical protein